MSARLRAIHISAVVLVVLLGIANADDAPGQRYLDAVSRKDISALQKQAYEQLARVHDSEYPLAITGFVKHSLTLRPRGRTLANSSSNDAIDVLDRMGFDVLPVLAEALDDPTPTCMPIYKYRGPYIASGPINEMPDDVLRGATRIGEWKVNQLVGTLIDTLADRDFIIVRDKIWYDISDVGDKPELAPEFKKLVLDWYAENAKRTPLERKIADLQSDVSRHRSCAISWIGAHKEKAGRDAVAARMEAILADDAGFNDHAGELAAGR